MQISLFGFKIGKAEDPAALAERVPSPVPPPEDDGEFIAGAAAYGYSTGLEQSSRSEAELVTKYRELAGVAEIDYAVDDIVNEAISADDGEMPVTLDLSAVAAPDAVKKLIWAEFDEVMRLLDFKSSAYDIFRRWYVDGRLCYHIMVDKKNPKAGIQELRNVDPRRIKKARHQLKPKPGADQAKRVPGHVDFYLFTPAGADGRPMAGKPVAISADSIAYVTSGLLDARNRMVQSYLHKAIKPANQLRTLEDATVIYRLVRAPERRMFYIDIGNLSKIKGEQHIRELMTKYKNKLTYDAATGEVKDDRKSMTMMEDYWLARRGGERGTEITTLAGGQNLGQIEDVVYFREKLYRALGIPVGRMKQDGGAFSMGRSAEVTRDEIKFSKFVSRLRRRFSRLFDAALEIQLALKGVMTREEWRLLAPAARYAYQRDNHFAEIEDQELMNSRLGILSQADQYVGKYFSLGFVRRRVLRMTDEEVEKIREEIDQEIAGGELVVAQPEGEPGLPGAEAQPADGRSGPPRKAK